MTRDLDIRFHNLNPQPSITSWIEQRVAKLEAMYPHITRCRVAVDIPHRRHRKGRRFNVQVDLTLPGTELVSHNHVQHAGSEQLASALAEAFRASERQLKAYSKSRIDRIHHRRRVGDVTNPDLLPSEAPRD